MRGSMVRSDRLYLSRRTTKDSDMRAVKEQVETIAKDSVCVRRSVCETGVPFSGDLAKAPSQPTLE